MNVNTYIEMQRKELPPKFRWPRTQFLTKQVRYIQAQMLMKQLQQSDIADMLQ